MTLLYRAIWTDDREHLDEALWSEAKAWISGKHRIDLPERGEVAIDGVRAEVRRADAEPGRVLRVVLEEDDGTGRHWTTTATSLESDSRTLWVDVDCHDSRRGAPVDISSPNLVRSLIEGGKSPRRGEVALSVTVQAVRPSEAGGLARALTDPARSVPVVVLAHDGTAPPRTTTRRGVEAAKVLAGLARVFMLPPETIDPFIEAMGRDFSVWGGAMRIYLPGWTEDEDPLRHRLLLPRQFSAFPRLPGLLVARRLAASVGRQRPPESWTYLRALLARPGESELERVQQAFRAGAQRRSAAQDAELAGLVHDTRHVESQFAELQRQVDELAELLAIAEAEREATVGDLQTEMGRLQQNVDDLQGQLVDAVDELELTVAERDRESAHARRLQILVGQAAITDDAWVAYDDRVSIDSITVEAPSQAVEVATERLSSIAIHPEACRDIERLDAALESRAWGATLWRGLCALHTYAVDVSSGFTGGFWAWCEKTGQWPASTKKLAMSESKTVLKNPKLARLRELPIDTRVDPSGLISMQAHLKIATGGGLNIPRVYFHDDTSGQTGLVHIGFIGPHDLMPNKSTN